jgi:hypothetical protein
VVLCVVLCGVVLVLRRRKRRLEAARRSSPKNEASLSAEAVNL